MCQGRTQFTQRMTDLGAQSVRDKYGQGEWERRVAAKEAAGSAGAPDNGTEAYYTDPNYWGASPETAGGGGYAPHRRRGGVFIRSNAGRGRDGSGLRGLNINPRS